MDRTDKQILNMLQKNARITNKELATEMGLSTTPVFERVKKMERSGIIKNYVAIVDNKKINKSMVAFLMVKLDKHSKGHLMNFQAAVGRLAEIMEVHHIAGNTDYLLRVALMDMEDFRRFMTDKFSAIENVTSVETLFVMDEIKKETAYQVA